MEKENLKEFLEELDYPRISSKFGSFQYSPINAVYSLLKREDNLEAIQLFKLSVLEKPNKVSLEELIPTVNELMDSIAVTGKVKFDYSKYPWYDGDCYYSIQGRAIEKYCKNPEDIKLIPFEDLDKEDQLRIKEALVKVEPYREAVKRNPIQALIDFSEEHMDLWSFGWYLWDIVNLLYSVEPLENIPEKFMGLLEDLGEKELFIEGEDYEELEPNIVWDEEWVLTGIGFYLIERYFNMDFEAGNFDT